MEGRVLGILVLFSTAALCTASSGHEFSSVGGIKAAMYATQAYYGGCYKLLNRTGPVGPQWGGGGGGAAPLQGHAPALGGPPRRAGGSGGCAGSAAAAAGRGQPAEQHQHGAGGR
ncbi:hypothetical protein HaLaN_09344, partial [Haematococcus lacustris]